MDDLLCNESWLSGSLSPEPPPNPGRYYHDDDVAMTVTPLDSVVVDEAISLDLERELCYSNHGHSFLHFLISNNLTDPRLQALQWLIQTRYRLNLLFETLFSAANYFDRFVSVTNCNEWTHWMVELVAVTSLSISSKFNEVTSPSLEDLQLKGLDHMFHHKTILDMEFIMLKALDWRVNSVTTYSFSQTLTSKMGLVKDEMMMTRITNHLLDHLWDLKMVEYSPSVAAAATLWTVLEEVTTDLGENLGRILNLFGQEHKEKIVKCVEVMKSRKIEDWSVRKRSCEVKNVLQREEVMNINGGDLSTIFQILRTEGSVKKRGRDGFEDTIRPTQRMKIVIV